MWAQHLVLGAGGESDHGEQQPLRYGGGGFTGSADAVSGGLFVINDLGFDFDSEGGGTGWR